jgi:FkbM family methyltransferase
MKQDLVFDLGMHKGEDTAFYLKKGFRVVGVEANPELAEFCRKRFAAEVVSGSVKIIEGAVVNKDTISKGTVTFYKNVGESEWGTIQSAWHDRNIQLGFGSIEIEVPCVDLGAIFEGYGVPYYMKIDLEGADRLCFEFLKGLPEKPKYLSIEDEKVYFPQIVKDLQTLCLLGYRRFRAVQQESIPGSHYQGLDRHGEPITHCFEVGASGPFGPDLSGPWMTAEEIMTEYRQIFRIYRIFGDDSLFARHPKLRHLRQRLSYYLRRPLPGWYDTHACA